ncbi:hypothetical protein P4O66_016026 [Electrophorus voltai]|uniref:Uncharacterized protein n=1 Tax=Electrophorus voltai TaxID=2609070 RepID=A0AAD8YUI8_9TELE|nr:hypothetical protein P4O66_016026 [Electrophorus voltai]
MDWMVNSGKFRSSGVCVMVSNSWCNNANVVTLACSCSPNLELLALKFRPFYLPWEFTSVIINTVYIPPQHITCPTRGKRTLDHCYTPYKDSYKALDHPPFGKSDHAAIFLIQKYKQRLKGETPDQREVGAGQVAALQDALDDALDDADWDMF